jgi:membrane associated rhomboid family serine protease
MLQSIATPSQPKVKRGAAGGPKLRFVSVTTAPATRRPRRDDRVRGVLFVTAMLAVMWVVEIIDQVFNANLDADGIRPHDVAGLDGIVFSPFLHAGFGHLLSNTVPFLVLGVVIALSGLKRVVLVTVIVALVAGLGVWLFAPSGTDHIGASGVVFGYAAYLIARGLFSRSALHLVAGAIVIAVWGGTLLSDLVPRDGISWQGHLFGAVGGVLAAWLLDRRRVPARGAAPVPTR